MEEKRTFEYQRKMYWWSK